jgi:DNA-binding MarR family transcriptional regulator
MTDTNSPNLESSYLALVEYLMLSKHQIVAVGAEHDLTGVQAMTIFFLDHPRPMRELTAIFNCDPSNITGIIDGLEEKQLAERCENPTDRRVKMVQLQPKGAAFRTTLLNHLVGPGSLILGKLSPTEVSQFITLVNKISHTN